MLEEPHISLPGRLTGYRLKKQPGPSILHLLVHTALNKVNTDDLAELVNAEVFYNAKKLV